MGIKGLNKFLKSHLTEGKGIHNINSSSLQDKVLIIDASIYLYKFICAIKNNSTDIYSEDGQIITHIQAILSRLMVLLKHKIKPVFVFDGKATKAKQDVLDNRACKKQEASSQLDDLRQRIKEIRMIMKVPAETKEDIENYKKLFIEFMEHRNKLKTMLKQSASLSSHQINECKKFLRILGIPVIESLEEADPQCAYIVKQGLGYAVSSEDMDLLTFGTTRLVTKLGANKNCIEYRIREILVDLDITMNQFIDICILLGCDYTSTLKGLGQKRILDAVKTYNNIEGIIKTGKYTAPHDFDYITAREMFKNPRTKDVNIEWQIPNYSKLETFLRSYAYSEDEIARLIDILKGGYYSVISGEKTLEQYKRDCSNFRKKKRVVKFDSDDEDD